jgi:hypothetical protein
VIYSALSRHNKNRNHYGSSTTIKMAKNYAYLNKHAKYTVTSSTLDPVIQSENVSCRQTKWYKSLGVTWALQQEAGCQMPKQWGRKMKLHYIKYEWKNGERTKL